MSKLQDENMILLQDVADLLPRVNGKRVHHSTVWRWATKGIDGVQLRAWRFGKRWMTNKEAVEEFVTAMAERSMNPDPPAPPRKDHSELGNRRRSTAQRERAVARAKKQLTA